MRKKAHILNYLGYPEDFIKNKNSPFFEKEDKKPDMEVFSLPAFSGEVWHYSIEQDWVYMLCKGEKSGKKQGWKVHITANICDAEDLLFAISKYLIHKEISFKFIPNKQELINRNAKYADRSESGKFITIYPDSTQIFIAILDDLKAITDLYNDGPYILNDKQWKSSNVFFRYGAFLDMRTRLDGRWVSSIQEPNGKMVEDKRVPYYYLPPFVEEPDVIKQGNGVVDPREFENLRRYSIRDTLHFSNGGGVYLAQKDNREYILKEGRPHAGLDGLNRDGYSRVRHEYNVLKLLQGLKGVVQVNDYFIAWNHNYIVEHKVAGTTLNDFIAQRFPFMNAPKEKSQAIQTYAENAIVAIKNLVKVVQNIHGVGYAIGDLQPNNIIFNIETQKLTLIDFETATQLKAEYKPSLATPLFVSDHPQTFEQADWLAVSLIAHYLFMPVDIFKTLSPELTKVHNERISEVFGEKVMKFLNKIDTYVARYVTLECHSVYLNQSLTLPKQDIVLGNIKEVMQGLNKGIAKHLDINSAGLIKGDPKQYLTGLSPYAIEYGGFGGAMALLRYDDTDKLMMNKIQTWASQVIPQVKKLAERKDADFGLFTGIAGICSVLYDLGLHNDAISLIKGIPIDVNDRDTSIFSGLSGIGLVLLSFYTLTNDESLLEKSIRIAKSLQNRYVDTIEEKGKQVNDIGLLNGQSGVSLFLEQIGKFTNDQSLISVSYRIIDNILNKDTKCDADNKLLLVDESRGFRRLLPYLNNGSAGLAMAMIQYACDDETYLTASRKDFLQQLVNSNNAYCSVMGGVINGYAGFLVLGNAVSNFYGSENQLNYLFEGLKSYLVGNLDHEILFPGNFGEKCAMDFSTGAAGVLLVLKDLTSDHWNSWFPLPQSTKLKLFSK